MVKHFLATTLLTILTFSTRAQSGRDIYINYCSACHGQKLLHQASNQALNTTTQAYINRILLHKPNFCSRSSVIEQPQCPLFLYTTALLLSTIILFPLVNSYINSIGLMNCIIMSLHVEHFMFCMEDSQ